MTSHPSIGQLATLACILEATAPKPGNVHPGAMFSDLKFRHFLASAIAIGPHMELARFLGVGQTVLDAITSTQQCVSTNTNLGMVLLLAPLAAVPREQSVEQGINKVLSLLNAKDSQQVYAAINLAKPGGMGTSHSHDLSAPAPDNLLWAMQAASDRDMVARQYCNDFADVIHFIAPRIAELSSDGHDLLTVIVATHVEVMSKFPDSLIARKCGTDVADQAARRAANVLAAGPIGSTAYHSALRELDSWLRADQHLRNPGTSADLATAGIFVALRDLNVNLKATSMFSNASPFLQHDQSTSL